MSPSDGHAAPHSPTVPGQRPSILFVDPNTADRCLPSLRSRFEVTAASSEDQAIRALRAFQPTLVITELALSDGDGVSICRQAKALVPNPPSVLATTRVPERVPEALLAGCDGVLVKPFAPNLLHTRIWRLLQVRVRTLTAAPAVEGRRPVAAGVNVVCRDGCCPSCGEADIISFDAASHRRSWYACLPCRSVWIAPRHDG
jgi:CheY-like chemotaxis protein